MSAPTDTVSTDDWNRHWGAYEKSNALNPSDSNLADLRA